MKDHKKSPLEAVKPPNRLQQLSDQKVNPKTIEKALNGHKQLQRARCAGE
jgi:hypothetical protein